MKLDIRQRLLATTLLMGAGLAVSPASAQIAVPPPPQPQPLPGTVVDPSGTPNAPDTSSVPTIPETTTPPAGQTVVSESAEGEAVDVVGEDIVVTGTRIPQPNLESASPVTVVTAQEVKLQGTTRTEDLINSLPQSFAAQGSNISNGATGTATVNLRGIGTSRTLVLVNGRRLMPGDPRSPVPDINFVPSPLIKRVDVLTGGASSVYGADAVAGVVNFILDTTFTGVRIDAQASTFMHENDTKDDILEANDAKGFLPPRGMSVNGLARDIAAVMGAAFDDGRGSVQAYVTYRDQESVLQSTRDYSFCALSGVSEATAESSGRRFNCGGSFTAAPANIFTPTFIGSVQGDQFDARTFGTLNQFNFAPFNFYQRPNERYTLGGFAQYEISELVQPYLEVMFMDDRSDAQIAPSGNFFATNTLNCDNPLLSAQQLAIACANLVGFDPDAVDDPTTPVDERATVFNGPTGQFNRGQVYIARRNVEGGGRNDDLQHTAYRLVGGLRGDIHRGLSYDAYYQYGTTLFAQTYQNDFSIRRLNQALDVVQDPDTGEFVCRGSLDGTADQGCVPFDIFDSNVPVTQDALNFLQTPGFARGNTREEIAHADMTILGGEYGLRSPWSDVGLALNVGAEYRRESLNFETDTAFSTGDLAGQGGPEIGVEGAFDVRELFAEAQVPLVTDTIFHDLTLTAGYRYSDYKVADNSFSTDTYKLAVEFAPVRDIRLRGSYNRAVRAPNVVELFSAQSIGLGGSSDPCAGQAVGGLVNGLTLAQCQRTGVSAAQFGNILPNPADQYNTLFGGNPNLEPETADTYTAGVVLQPRFIPGLAVTVDYFDIKVRDTIGSVGTDTTIDQCIQTGDPFFCDRINRAPGSGSLFLAGGFTEDINTNIGGLATSGVDVNASYARGIGRLGNLNLSFVGTWLDELSVDVGVGDVEFDCAGFFGNQCGTPNPEWRHKFRAGFVTPGGIGLSGQWRYFSGVDVDASSDDDDLTAPPTSAQLFPGNDRLNERSYFDLTMTARMAERYYFRLGANNIFDTDPPIAGGQVVGAGFGNGNTFPQVYDSLGRFLFAGVTVDF